MRDFDPVEFMLTEEGIAAYLKTAAKLNDKEHFLDCLRDATRAREINRLALETGIDRQEIFEMLTPGGEETTVEPNPILISKISAVFGVTAPVHV